MFGLTILQTAVVVLFILFILAWAWRKMRSKRSNPRQNGPNTQPAILSAQSAQFAARSAPFIHEIVDYFMNKAREAEEALLRSETLKHLIHVAQSLKDKAQALTEAAQEAVTEAVMALMRPLYHALLTTARMLNNTVDDFLAPARRQPKVSVMRRLKGAVANMPCMVKDGDGVLTKYYPRMRATQTPRYKLHAADASPWSLNSYMAQARHEPTVSALIMSAPRVMINQVSTVITSLVVFQFKILSLTFNYLIAPALLVPGKIAGTLWAMVQSIRESLIDSIATSAGATSAAVTSALVRSNSIATLESIPNAMYISASIAVRHTMRRFDSVITTLSVLALYPLTSAIRISLGSMAMGQKVVRAGTTRIVKSVLLARAKFVATVSLYWKVVWLRLQKTLLGIDSPQLRKTLARYNQRRIDSERIDLKDFLALHRRYNDEVVEDDSVKASLLRDKLLEVHLRHRLVQQRHAEHEHRYPGIQPHRYPDRHLGESSAAYRLRHAQLVAESIARATARGTQLKRIREIRWYNSSTKAYRASRWPKGSPAPPLVEGEEFDEFDTALRTYFDRVAIVNVNVTAAEFRQSSGLRGRRNFSITIQPSDYYYSQQEQEEDLAFSKRKELEVLDIEREYVAERKRRDSAARKLAQERVQEILQKRERALAQERVKAEQHEREEKARKKDEAEQHEREERARWKKERARKKEEESARKKEDKMARREVVLALDVLDKVDNKIQELVRAPAGEGQALAPGVLDDILPEYAPYLELAKSLGGEEGDLILRKYSEVQRKTSESVEDIIRKAIIKEEEALMSNTREETKKRFRRDSNDSSIGSYLEPFNISAEDEEFSKRGKISEDARKRQAKRTGRQTKRPGYSYNTEPLGAVSFSHRRRVHPRANPSASKAPTWKQTERKAEKEKARHRRNTLATLQEYVSKLQRDNATRMKLELQRMEAEAYWKRVVEDDAL